MKIALGRIRKIPLSMQMLIAVLLGVPTGLYLGQMAIPLGEVGKVVIQLIKVIAAPLLFVSVINAIVETHIDLKSGLRMFFLASINACIALCIGLFVSNYFRPGDQLKLETLRAMVPTAGGANPAAGVQEIDFLKSFISYIPTNLFTPFIENNIISIVILALLFGFGIRRALVGARADTKDTVAEFLRVANTCLEMILAWVVCLAPLAVFAVVARSVGEYGLSPLVGVGAYVGAGLLGLGLHLIIVYHAWLIFVIRMPLKFFWSIAKEPVIYAFGANSSLATLPLTLKALDKLGVSKKSASLGACIGTNFNNDGIILYEAMAVLFVAQAYGIHLGLGQQLVVAITCLIAAMGVAGVPEAGFVSLALVLTTCKLPTEILPILLTVDWILARARSGVNVMADMNISMLVEKWDNPEFPKPRR